MPSALAEIVRASDPLRAALAAAHSLQLDSWCIGAGAVRNMVWDHLHGVMPSGPLADVDLCYFAPNEPPGHERALQAQLAAMVPGVVWDVTNQAHVHQWYARDYGQAVAPLRSLEEGVATWPEYATCVGVYLSGPSDVHVIAPYGLSDLWGLMVRHNPVRASAEVFKHRYTSKRWLERWPRLRLVEPCAGV